MSLMVISAIEKWMHMIFVIIIWTEILTFIRRLLPIFRVYYLFLADMPDWICHKTISPRRLKLFRVHCQSLHHQVFQFTKHYRQGIHVVYTDIMPNIIRDIMHNVVPDGLVPPLDKEAAGIITGSEATLCQCKCNQ